MRNFRFFKMLMCLVCGLLFLAACENNGDNTSTPELSFRETTIIVAAAGEQQFVHYDYNGDLADVEATVDDSWVHTIDLSNEGYVGFIVDKNPGETGRTTFIRLNAPNCEEAALKIVQIKGEPAEFTINVTEVGADTATYTVIPFDEQRPFISMVVTKETMDSYNGSDDDFFLNDLMYFQALADGYGVTIEDVIRQMSLNGAQSMTWNGLSQNTEYCAYAYGVTVMGQRTTSIVREYFKTEPITSNNQLTLDIANISTVEFDLVIGTTNEEDGYIWEVQEASWFDGLDDEQVVEEIKLMYGEYVDMIVEYGSNTVHIGPTSIEPDTEYTAVLFGYEAGGMTTPMIRKTFRTQKGISAEDLRFDFEVKNIGRYDAEVSVSPSGNSVYYYWDVIDADMSAAEFEALMKEYESAYIEAGIVGSASEFWYEMTERGYSSSVVGQLNSNTEYKPVAVAIDVKNAVFAGEVYFGDTFRTKEAVVADVAISVEHNEYFDGDELVARYASQGLYTSYAGLAYVPFYPHLENNPAHYYYAIFYYEEGLDDKNEWSDESLMHILLQDCLMDIDRWYPGLEWDVEYILLAIAQDSDGNFGPLYRERMSFNREETTDIDLFEEIVQSPKSMKFSVAQPTMKYKASRIEAGNIKFGDSVTESAWEKRVSVR